MLGVFLLLAFTRLGHECQDLFESVMECLSAQTRPLSILSSKRVLGEWSQNRIAFILLAEPLPDEGGEETGVP